jgi:hypothetical protein
LAPALRRSLLARRQQSPAAYGWRRTRWSGARLALEGQAQRGISWSAETVRRGRQARDGVGKRSQLAAPDSAPERAAKGARIRPRSEPLGPRAALLLADELELPRLPPVGAPWMPKATPAEVRRPGRNEPRHRAGAWHRRTGRVRSGLWLRPVNGWFLDWLNLLDRAYPARRWDRILAADNDKIHQATLLQRWRRQHSRLQLLLLPADCPRANPLERCCGERHDKVRRHHRRKRRRDLVHAGKRRLPQNGAWRCPRSEIYQAVEGTQALKQPTACSSSAVACMSDLVVV